MKDRTRKVRQDTYGTLSVNIPASLAKALGLEKGSLVALSYVSSNKLLLTKVTVGLTENEVKP